MIINRNKQFEKRHEYEMPKIKKDIAIQKVQMIDDDGNIKSEEKHVVIDESEQIAQIPAYTTKIEYMEQYGTIDKNNIVKYAYANPMSEIDVIKLRDQILQENIEFVEKPNENKEDVKPINE